MHLDLISDLLTRYRSQVDFLLIRLEEAEGSELSLRDGHWDTLSETLSRGGQVRACYRGGWGFASFNRLDNLAEQIEAAISAARLVGAEHTCLATVSPQQLHLPLRLHGSHPRHVPMADKKALCQHYHSILQGDAIVSSVVSYSDSLQHIWLGVADPDHDQLTLIDQSWVDLEMRCAATARQGDRIQTGRETTGSRRGFEAVQGLEKQMAAAASRAVHSLDLHSVRGGSYTVVIDPILSGLFVHEAFGHLSEADMAYENPDLLEVMTLGRRFGPPELTIRDGAAPDGHRGSYAFDDEGIPASTTTLIEAGRLVGRLHSRETAAHLGEQPTGNARCLSYAYMPIVRMTNTWIEPGSTPAPDLLQGIEEGIYARNWLEGMTNGEMFTFTAAEAWMIRNGQLAEPIRDVTLSGNVFQTLADIEAIGNDFAWDEAGGCGKGGQNGLPVGVGGPSLRIRDVVVGGDL